MRNVRCHFEACCSCREISFKCYEISHFRNDTTALDVLFLEVGEQGKVTWQAVGRLKSQQQYGRIMIRPNYLPPQAEF